MAVATEALALEKLEIERKIFIYQSIPNSLQLRNIRSTIVQLLAPAFFIIALYILQEAIASNQFFGDFYDVKKTQTENHILGILTLNCGN
jgi:hypothetical protein